MFRGDLRPSLPERPCCREVMPREDLRPSLPELPCSSEFGSARRRWARHSLRKTSSKRPRARNPRASRCQKSFEKLVRDLSSRLAPKILSKHHLSATRSLWQTQPKVLSKHRHLSAARSLWQTQSKILPKHHLSAARSLWQARSRTLWISEPKPAQWLQLTQ